MVRWSEAGGYIFEWFNSRDVRTGTHALTSKFTRDGGYRSINGDQYNETSSKEKVTVGKYRH